MKYFYCLLMAVFITSCTQEGKVVIDKSEYESLKGIKPPIYPKHFRVQDRDYEIYLGSDGHEYYNTWIGESGYNVRQKDFHYPDCIKCQMRQGYKINPDSIK